MKIRPIAESGGSLPPSLAFADYLALREMLSCVSSETGPVLRASSFLGYGEAGGGGYAGHAEIYDLDGLLRDTYRQPSMEPGVNDTLFGGGKGFGLPNTLFSTVGEAVERAVAALVGCSPHLPSPRVLGTFDQLTANGYPALDPEALGLFSQAQYESPSFLYRRFTRDTAVQWVEGRRLVAATPIWVPAQLIDMVHIYDPAEEIIGYPVSGGLSCHTSTVAATYHGLTEVIERDAVNVSWYTDAAPLRVRLTDAVRDVLGPFVDRMRLDHTESHLLLHPSGVCSAPTFSVVGIQRWLRRRQYCAGGGCDVVMQTALRKAAAEFGQTRGTLAVATTAPRSAVGRSVETMFDWTYGRSLSEMELFFQAIGYYGLDEYLPHLEHYLSGPEVDLDEVRPDGDARPTDRATVAQRLEFLLGELGEQGVDPIVLDYSHPEWKQLAVVKVYVPELTTPFLQSRPMLGHPRLAALRPSLRTSDGMIQPLPYP